MMQQQVMGRKQGPSADRKLQAVLSLLRKEEPAAKIARRYGVSDASLYRWRDEFLAGGKMRLTEVLSYLGIRTSRWYYKPVPESERKQTIRLPLTVPPEITAAVVKMAEDNPWYCYKRIAVMCRREEVAVSNRQAYRVMKKNGLLHERRKAKSVELDQAPKLYALLPRGPNDLWQTDVTYIHIPGYGWHYAVTVIDYYSRYLPACRFTWSYTAESGSALEEAIEEVERLFGPLRKPERFQRSLQ